MTRVLILCTGNSCRSQMAEGFLRSFDPALEVFSAGTYPAKRVHPLAIRVMKEAGIDISDHTPKSVDEFLDQAFDYVITVCDNAREACPVFSGKVGHKIHLGFPDPSEVIGPEATVLKAFREVRDDIKNAFFDFSTRTLKHA